MICSRAESMKHFWFASMFENPSCHPLKLTHSSNFSGKCLMKDHLGCNCLPVRQHSMISDNYDIQLIALSSFLFVMKLGNRRIYLPCIFNEVWGRRFASLLLRVWDLDDRCYPIDGKRWHWRLLFVSVENSIFNGEFIISYVVRKWRRSRIPVLVGI